MVIVAPRKLFLYATWKNLKQNSFDYYGEEKNEFDIYALPKYTIPVEWKSLRGEKEIEISGRLIGGCQDVINGIVGTRFDKVKKFLHKYRKDGFVWFLETFSIKFLTACALIEIIMYSLLLRA